MKIGLILSGGGTRGLAQVGALKVIHRLKIPITMIAGCSIGAIIGALYASGKTPEEIEAFARTIDVFKLVDISLSKVGLMRGRKIQKAIEDFVGVKRFSQLKIPLYVNAVNIYKEKEVVFSRGDLWQAIRASISIPGIFYPEEIRGEYYVDGGVMNNLPFSILPPMDKYIMIDVGPYWERQKKKKQINIFHLLYDTIMIMEGATAKAKLNQLPKEKYVLIKPNLEGHLMLEKKDQYIPLIEKGELAARRKRKELLRLVGKE